MLRRSFLFLAVAAVALAGRTTLAGDSHTGIVVRTDPIARTLTMTDMEGKNEHTHHVLNSATIMLDDKVISLFDLKKGCEITVTTDGHKHATKIEAKSKEGKSK